MDEPRPSAPPSAHPEIEFSIADGPAPGRWKGVAEMAIGWCEFLGAWEDFRAEEVDEYRELDGERMLALQRLSVRGKRSGRASNVPESAVSEGLRDVRSDEEARGLTDGARPLLRARARRAC